MWDISPGIDFASRELLRFDLHPAHCLYLARKYDLSNWIEGAVRKLIASPLEHYTNESTDTLPFPLYQIIATTKESIFLDRMRLANHPPFPPNFDGQPYCSHHETCKRVWTEKWFYTMGRRIHNPTSPLPLLKVPDALEALDHPGMNRECKSSILTWMRESCAGVQREEIAICGVIATVRDMFM
jgi:hypothetical protein